MQRRDVLKKIALIGLGAGGADIFIRASHTPFISAFPSAAAYSATDSAPDLRAQAAATDIPEMSYGNENAPITLVEYASFTCPHCRDFHLSVYPRIKADYIDTDKVRFVLREVYFDKYGLWAAIIARCDNNSARYFAIYDQLMRQQNSWTRGSAQEVVEKISRIGRAAGLSTDAIRECLKNGARAKAMVELSRDNMQKDRVNATPYFTINGESYSNMGFDKFAEIFDALLQKSAKKPLPAS